MKEVELNSKSWAMLFFLAAPQVSYFLPGGYAVSYALGFLLFLYAVIGKDIRVSYRKIEVLLIGVFVYMALLGLLLFFLGEAGEYESRNIAVSFLLQVIVVLLVLSFVGSNDHSKLAYILLGICVFEIFIILGQYFYVVYGVGFSKRGEYGVDSGMLTGSLQNPNNSAAMLGLFVLTLTIFFVMERRFSFAYIVLLGSFLPIFLLLSRTMTVLWFLNFAVVFFTANFTAAFSRSPSGNSYLPNLFFLSALSLSVWLGFSYFYSAEEEVFSRSSARLATLTSLGGDSSVGFRIVSHERLFENLGSLGIGSFSDLNYGSYFDSGDPALMKINPHSYIVEYSFLFGYFGFFAVMFLFGLLVVNIFLNTGLGFAFRLLACFALFFVQAVPSSLLMAMWFFVPFIFISNMRDKI